MKNGFRKMLLKNIFSLCVFILVSSLNTAAHGGAGIVMSGQIAMIFGRTSQDSTIRMVKVNEAIFWVDEKNVTIFGTVAAPVSYVPFSLLRVGDYVTVIGEDDPRDSTATVRIIILMPAPKNR